MKQPPDVIYLQWEGVDRAELTHAEIQADKLGNTPSHGDVTWCADKQFDTDVKYVKAVRASLEQENRRIMQAMYITWDEETGYEVGAEPEPQYFDTWAEAVEFWVKLANLADGAGKSGEVGKQ